MNASDTLLNLQRKLVHLVRERPILYQPRRPEGPRRPRVDVEAALNQIAETLGCWTVPEVRKEWSVLRQKYRAISKRMKQGEQHQTYFALFSDIHAFLRESDDETDPVCSGDNEMGSTPLQVTRYSRRSGRDRHHNGGSDDDDDGNDDGDDDDGGDRDENTDESPSGHNDVKGQYAPCGLEVPPGLTAAPAAVLSTKRRHHEPGENVDGDTEHSSRKRETRRQPVPGEEGRGGGGPKSRGKIRSLFAAESSEMQAWDLPPDGKGIDGGSHIQAWSRAHHRSHSESQPSLSQSPSPHPSSHRTAVDDVIAASSTCPMSPTSMPMSNFDLRFAGLQHRPFPEPSPPGSLGKPHSYSGGADLDPFLKFVGDSLAKMSEDQQKEVKKKIFSVLV